MICSVNIKFFNGYTRKTEIDLFVDKISLNTDMKNKSKIIDNQAYDLVRSRILSILAQSNLENIFSFNFQVVSKDSEYFNKLNISVERNSLVKALTNLLKIRILESLGSTYLYDFNNDQLHNDFIARINENIERFKSLYLDHEYFNSDKIIAIEALIQKRKYALAKAELTLLKDTESNCPTIFDICRIEFILEIKLNSQGADLQKLFNKNIDKFRESPSRVSSFYFDYIKHLENSRNSQQALNYIQQFENNYSLDSLTDEQKIYFFYLIGRSNYLKGDYIKGLKFLSEAIILSKAHGDYLLSKLYNTATNIFNDNLFFQYAEYLAKEAISLRKKSNSVNLYESYSCLAGIYFRNRKFEKSLEYFSKAKGLIEINKLDLTSIELNRINNYLAKCYIMLGQTDKADIYLVEACKHNDSKGFSFYLKLLKLLMMKEYRTLIAEFNKVALENNSDNFNLQECDNFVLGWSYYFVAEAKEKTGEYEDAVEFFDKSIKYFIADNYILEASYLYHISEIKKFASFKTKKQVNTDLDQQVKESIYNFIEKHYDIVTVHSHLFEDFISDNQQEDINILEYLNLIDSEAENKSNADNILSNICLF